MSDIIIAATTEAVADIIHRHRIIHVTQADMEQITKDIENPPELNEALIDAVRSYKKLVETGELVIRH